MMHYNDEATMNPQAALLARCLRSLREANRPGAVDRRSIGDEITWAVSPTDLARTLKGRLLSPSTLGVNWLSLSVALMTEVYRNA